MGFNRSRLLMLALQAHWKARQQKKILDQLNRFYGDVDPAEARLAHRMKAKLRSTLKDRWCERDPTRRVYWLHFGPRLDRLPLPSGPVSNFCSIAFDCALLL